MRCAVIADVHGNYHALEAVLADIDQQGVDAILCLGDVIGYAARPKECVQAVRERATCVVAGNHDHGSVDKINLAYFNADARDAIEWTKEQLSQEELSWLAELPLTAQFEGMELVHSTPYYPEYFSYIQTLYDAALAFSKLQSDICFVGHSHVPITFVNSDPIDYFLVAEFELPDQKLLLNVGSVGQPRDLDCRACYALLDNDRRMAQLRRVTYDVTGAAEAIFAADLPATNAQRLFLGR